MKKTQYIFPRKVQSLPPATIDFHTHIDIAPTFGWIDPPQSLLPLLDDANVERAVVMTYRDATPSDTSPIEYVRDALHEWPERFIGFARLYPTADGGAAKLLRQAVSEFGFRGLKLHPVSTLQHPAEKATVHLVKAASELGVPVLFHCGDEDYCTPLAIEQLVKQVPGATVVLGHMGGYSHSGDAIAVAERNDNVYLETSATPNIAYIQKAVAVLGADRILYGSDGPGAPPRLEVRKILSAGFSREELAKILRSNALGILGQ